MSLITSARALLNLPTVTSPTSGEEDLIDALIEACGTAIERHCRRGFASASYDELYDGNGRPVLLLQQMPVLSVERVAYDPTPVFLVRNSSASQQRATVKVTATGLSLTRVASGVSTTSTVAFAGNATLSALETAVEALGNGWEAEVVSGFGLRASVDLRGIQGALNAKDAYAELRLHVQELTSFDVDAERGRLVRGVGGIADGPTSVFFGGRQHWRVIYTAGFSTVPEDVQEACAQWVAALFWQSKRDPNLVQEVTSGLGVKSPRQDMPAMVEVLLRPYRLQRIV